MNNIRIIGTKRSKLNGFPTYFNKSEWANPTYRCQTIQYNKKKNGGMHVAIIVQVESVDTAYRT